MRKLSLCSLERESDRPSFLTDPVERERDRAALAPRARSGTSLLRWLRLGMRRGEGEAEIVLGAAVSYARSACEVSIRREVWSET